MLHQIPRRLRLVVLHQHIVGVIDEDMHPVLRDPIA
jgi:hypothetical protein